MLYVGIDQHRKQLTVSIRDEAGTVILRRQVSTLWEKVRAFFNDVQRKNAANRDDIATWFDWLELDDYVTFGGKP